MFQQFDLYTLYGCIMIISSRKFIVIIINYHYINHLFNSHLQLYTDSCTDYTTCINGDYKFHLARGFDLHYYQSFQRIKEVFITRNSNSLYCTYTASIHYCKQQLHTEYATIEKVVQIFGANI